jgi:hypothetical protein
MDDSETLKAALQQDLLQTVSRMIISRMSTACDTAWLETWSEIAKLLSPAQLAFVLREMEARMQAAGAPTWIPVHGVPPPAGACGSDDGELYEPPDYPPADSDSDSEDP